MGAGSGFDGARGYAVSRIDDGSNYRETRDMEQATTTGRSDREPADTTRRAWHALGADEALAALGVTASGLSAEEARARLERYGPNTLPEARRRGPLRRFLEQFNNVLVIVLLVAGAVTLALGHLLDAGVIAGVVIVNAFIGFVQEGKAERALEAVRAMLPSTAIAWRDGARTSVRAETLVPGDVVFVQSGDRVPADLRLLRAKNLRVNEAALTGESLSSEKSDAPVAPDAPLGDRACLAFSGTVVDYGQGTGVVVATGAATEIGRISALVSQVTTLETPLLRRLGEFGRRLSAAILALAVATFAFGYLVRGYTAAEMFLAVVGLAVAAIPEGLPAIVTIALALGTQRMARRNAIVRRLPAVETLGSVTVICSDKTGTLTRNEMTVATALLPDGDLAVSGAGYAPEGEISRGGARIDPAADRCMVELARAGLLCNDAELRHRDGEWRLAGDPTEGALVTLAVKAGLDADSERRAWPRKDEIPFESEHRFMATLHHDHHGHAVAYLKGAPERVLELCREEGGTGNAVDPARWEARLEAAAARGERLLGLAARRMEDGRDSLSFEEIEPDFVLLGFVGMIDPPRDEAIAAVKRCQAAGVRVKMITGDHAVTAHAIGRTLGLSEAPPVTGQALEGMVPEALAQVAAQSDVFARASPEHKLKLVEALQARRQVVAMTGDGVNDAPALKRADIGVAMGIKGTDAAKEAAEMVLTDDNFASIANAVEEGRTIYDNIKKALLFILPTNGGEAGIILVATFLGLTLPLTAVQILWVNMVTAVTLALALSFEPAERDVMARPPRPPDEPLLTRFLVARILFVSALLVAACMLLFEWSLARGESVEAARTVAVNMLVAGEIVYLFNSRHFTASSLNAEGFTGNRIVLYAVAALAVLQAAFTYLPQANGLFHTAPIQPDEWLAIAAASVALFLTVEAEKAWRRRTAAPPAC
jgi:magnesium-transporting ATPase (P-type)